jgi:hypothetical protein
MHKGFAPAGGWPAGVSIRSLIGSRCKQSGMFWTVRGANAILALRCCQFNGRLKTTGSSAALDYWSFITSASRTRLYFFDLLDVPLGMRSDVQNPLVCVQLAEDLASRRVGPQIGLGVADERDGPVAALLEGFGHGVPVWPLSGRLETLRRLGALAAVGHQRGNAAVVFSAFLLLLRRRRLLQHTILDYSEQKILGQGDVFGHLRHRPPLWRLLVPPLGLRQARRRVQKLLAGGVQITHRAVAFALGQRLGGRRHADGGQD